MTDIERLGEADRSRSVQPTTASDLIARYDGFLLDAFGVLVDKTGPIEGAARFIERLDAAGKPYMVLTNSASRLPETMAREFAEVGLPIAAERVLTSGMMLSRFFAAEGLIGAPCIVLGPAESITYLERAGGRAVADGEDAEIIIIADQKGFPCLERMDQALSVLLRRLDRREPVRLVLCNPDLIYPVGPGTYGFTAGGLAAMLSAVVAERYPELPDPMVRLGKPYSPLFREGLDRLGVARVAMLGDQLATDVLGANRCGIDSVLVGTGLARDLVHGGSNVDIELDAGTGSAVPGIGQAGIRPTYIVRSLA